MKEESPLYSSLKKLSHDIRELVELSAHETDDSWEKMIETVKGEIVAELSNHSRHEQKAEDYVYSSMIADIYDYLNILIKRMKDSQDKLRIYATRDLLTGLYNRNYFNESIIADIQKAIRNHEKLSVIMIDINDFKFINDTYGHVHGDGVIKECAGLLRSSVRKSDFLCRYGGDEFVIVTPMATCQDNIPLFDRIRGNLDEWNKNYSTFDYSLSVSIGCAVWEEGMDFVDVLHEADQNMYKDKQRRQDNRQK